MKEYLNLKKNKKIEKLAMRITSQNRPQPLSNQEWLDREEWRRIAKGRFRESFFRTNVKEKEDD